VRVRPLAMLVAALFLAGCTGGGAESSDDLALEAGTGVLFGLVVDDAVRPVAGAAVNLTGRDVSVNQTTDEEGRFSIADLLPGAYVVRVSKEFYTASEQAVVVAADVPDPELVRFQITFEPGSLPYVNLYKFEGFFECSAWPTNGCANVNILTGIVLCSLDLPCFNVTGDRSVELIPIDGIPTYLQSEMVWEPTNPMGESMIFGLGSATREELQDGFADGHNGTQGRSPLMLSLDEEIMLNRSIGGERMLLIQVSAGVTQELPVCPPELGPPCGVGASAQQPYTTYTHAFHGFFPPAGWLFTVDGPLPPP
jgi:hypothetical protein